MRCRRVASVRKRVKVEGDERAAGRRLFLPPARFAPIGGKRPPGYIEPRPKQNAGHGRGTPLRPRRGIGGAEQDGIAERAIAWATERRGSSAYRGLGLAFVSQAFLAPGFPATATIAANELGPREGDKSARAAPRGSLMWFSWGDPNRGRNNGHVGISLGDGSMIHSLDVLRVDRIDGSWWRSNYRGWTPPPASWPGLPSRVPPPQPLPVPSSPIRRVVTVDNRTTDGIAMRQDSRPLRLTTIPRTYCGTLGCEIGGTDRTTGETYDAAVCTTTGERYTNGHDGSTADDANPELIISYQYYGVRLPDGTFGFVSWVWIRAADRGLDLPPC